MGAAGLATAGIVGEARADRSKAKGYRRSRRGTDVDVGGAIIGVNKPIDEVLKVCMTFRKYSRILPRLETTRLVGRRGKKHDVYMRAPILRGMYSIWMVSEFTGPLQWRTHGKRIVGKMKKGNLEAFDGQWKLHPCGPKRTILRLELFLIPKVPVPSSWIAPELEWAAKKGVTGVRDIAECGKSTVKDD